MVTTPWTRAGRRGSDARSPFVTWKRDDSFPCPFHSDPLLFAQRERIVGLASKRRMPASYEWREFAEAGGMMSYGASITDQYRRLATYVDKILKGAKPGDLPVEQPTKFELVINRASRES